MCLPLHAWTQHACANMCMCTHFFVFRNSENLTLVTSDHVIISSYSSFFTWPSNCLCLRSLLELITLVGSLYPPLFWNSFLGHLFFIIIKIYPFRVCVSVSLYMHPCCAFMWRSREQLLGVSPLLPLCGSLDWTQDIRLGDKRTYPLSCLTRPPSLSLYFLMVASFFSGADAPLDYVQNRLKHAFLKAPRVRMTGMWRQPGSSLEIILIGFFSLVKSILTLVGDSTESMWLVSI